MKKSYILAAAAIMLMQTGCVKTPGVSRGAQSSDKLSIVTTIFAPYDFARELAGGEADIKMLLPPASESHSFEPTPQDILRIQNCDIFIYVGGESDVWADRVLGSMDTSGIRAIKMTECVETVEEELAAGMEADNEDENENAGPAADEHVWTSPANAASIVNRLADEMIAADPANAGVYERNRESYIVSLAVLDQAFRDAAKDAKRTTVVFADRFPFRYLFDAYGLTYFAAFPGCSAEAEASAATLAFLINKVKDEQIPTVFHLELGNERMADAVCEATGAEKKLLHSCHNISKAEFESGASYIGLMTANAQRLKEALN